MFIIEEHAPTQTDIANRIQISSPSISWYVKRLIEIKLIVEIKDGRYKRYQLRDKETSKYITALMRNYYPTIWDRWSERLAEIFLSLSVGESE